jgi:F-type H+-transporting ATPase subunit delta
MKAKPKVRRAARRLFRLCLTGGVLDDARAGDVARQVATSGRRMAPRVLVEFLRLVRLNRGRYTAVVESTVPLTDSLRERVQADLMRAHGPALQTSFVENPALLGGLRIKVAGKVYDGSVRARLQAIAARFS